jgi:surfeit locus 1 family protein
MVGAFDRPQSLGWPKGDFMRRKDWGFIALAVLAAAVFVRLGFWQLSRLQERRAHNDLIRQRMDLPAQPIDQAIEAPSDWTFRPVTLQGTFDADHEILLSPRSYQDQPGVDLVTPLVLQGKQGAVLVNRGWIPYEDIDVGPRAAFRTQAAVEVEGLVMASQPSVNLFLLPGPPTPSPEAFRVTWQTVDIPSLQTQMPYPLLPFFVAQTNSLSPAEPPIPDPGIDLSDGPHLSYAMQWFAFALIALVGGVAWVRRRARRNGTGESD